MTEFLFAILCGAIGGALGMGLFFFAGFHIGEMKTDRTMKKLQLGKYRV